VSEFAFVVVDLFVLLSVAAQSHYLRELMVANLKNRVVSQNLAEVELPRLEPLATVSYLPLNPLSEIEGAFVVAVDLVEQDRFAMAVVVVENQVAGRSVEWDEAETVVEVAESPVACRAVSGESVAAVEDAENQVAGDAQIQVVDRQVEGERMEAEVELLSAGSVAPVVVPS